MDKIYCPICGKENNCAHANNKDPKTCWCMEAKISEDTLKKLQESKKNNSKGCFCKSCVDKFRKS